MTSFSRLAKVIKGYTPPVGWVERAFAGIMTAIGSVLPSYTISDENKVLTIGKDEGHLVNVSIINLQSVTLGATSKGRLAADSWDFSSLVEDETLTLMVDNTPISCKVISGAIWSADEENTYVSNTGIVNLAGLSGYANKTVAMSCSKSMTEYNPVLEWKAASGSSQLIIRASDSGEQVVMDKTAAEIYAAMPTGCVVLYDNAFICPITYAEYSHDSYLFCVSGMMNWNPGPFAAMSGNDYPITND